MGSSIFCRFYSIICDSHLQLSFRASEVYWSRIIISSQEQKDKVNESMVQFDPAAKKNWVYLTKLKKHRKWFRDSTYCSLNGLKSSTTFHRLPQSTRNRTIVADHLMSTCCTCSQVCTGVYNPRSTLPSDQTSIITDKVFHGHRDLVLQPDLVEPNHVVEDVEAAVNLLLQREAPWPLTCRMFLSLCNNEHAVL